MSILSRYILRELFLSSTLFFAVFAILFTLILGTINIRDFIILEPSIAILIKIYVLTFYQLLSLLIPLSTFFGTLISMYRLREDGELLALFSLGFTLKDLLIPVMTFMIIIFVLTHLSHFYLLPHSKREKKLTFLELKKRVSQKTFPIKKPVGISENLYVYVRALEAEGETLQVSEIFLFERGPSGKRALYQAEKADIFIKKGIFHLKNGMVFSMSANKELEVLSFESYSLHLGEGGTKTERINLRRGEMTLSELQSAVKENRGKDQRQYTLLLSEYYHRHLYAISITPLIVHAFLLSFLVRFHHRLYLFLSGVIFYTIFYYSYNLFLSFGEKGNLNPLQAFVLFNILSFLTIIIELYLIHKRSMSSVFK